VTVVDARRGGLRCCCPHCGGVVVVAVVTDASHWGCIVIVDARHGMLRRHPRHGSLSRHDVEGCPSIDAQHGGSSALSHGGRCRCCRRHEWGPSLSSLLWVCPHPSMRGGAMVDVALGRLRRICVCGGRWWGPGLGSRLAQ